MGTTKTVAISLKREMVEDIDKRRGLMPRSRFIGYMIQKGLEWESKRDKQIRKELETLERLHSEDEERGERKR